MKKLLLLSILLITIYSCSKDDEIPQQENYTKLATNVIEIKSDIQVSDISDNSISFNSASENIRNLNIGDVIFSGSTTDNPNGYARKIVKIENQGNKTTLQTTQAKINEVFEEININTPLKIDYSKQPIVSAKGKTSKNNIFSKSLGDDPFYDKLEFNFNATTNKYEYEIEFKKDVNSNLNGKISFKGSFQIKDEGSEFVYNVRPFTDKVFSIQNKMKVIMDNSIKVSGSLKAEKKTFELAKIPLTYTSPTSLVVNIYLVMRIGVSGEISAEFSVENTTTTSIDCLLSYTEDNGWLALSTSKSDTETNFEGDLKLEIKSYFEPGIKIVFEQFRGINAGIYVESYLKFNAELNNNLDIDWDLGYNVKAKGEAKINFLDNNFINEDYELVFWEKGYTELIKGTYEVPEKIYEGNAFLFSQQEVDDFGKNNYSIAKGLIYIKGNDIIDLSSLSNLKEVEELVIQENNALNSLKGLENIRTVNSDLELSGNNAFNNINEFINITSIGGKLNISEQKNLTDLSGFGNVVSVIGDLSINGNNFNNINGLEKINSVGNFLNISDNDNLINLNGIKNITSVSSGVQVFDNDKLINIDGLSNLTSVGGGVLIGQNWTLSDLCGITNLIQSGFSNSFNTHNNIYNPTIENIKNGNCKQ